MADELERLLWRLGCRMVREEALTVGLEEERDRLLDERSGRRAGANAIPRTVGPWVDPLKELEEGLDRIRVWTRQGRFREAVNAARDARGALERARLAVVVASELDAVGDAWRRLVDRFGLAAARALATPRTIERLLAMARRSLEAGELRKARTVTAVAGRQIEVLGRTTDDEALGRALDQRLATLRSSGEDGSLADQVEEALRARSLELARHLLDDRDMLASPDGSADEREPAETARALRRIARFERIAQASEMAIESLAPTKTG